jgi:hypothetical protein
LPGNPKTATHKAAKGERRNDEEINWDDPISVVAEERLPPLRWGCPMPCHVFGDRGLTNFDAELEEFTWHVANAVALCSRLAGKVEVLETDFRIYLRSRLDADYPENGVLIPFRFATFFEILQQDEWALSTIPNRLRMKVANFIDKPSNSWW